MVINLNGVNYYYEIAGQGEPLMLLHGFTGDVSTWKLSRLSDSFKVITIDIIGHGKSDAPADPNRYTMEAVAKDLCDMLNILGINRIHLLGYSMGGRLALSFTMFYPERVKTLILESSSPGLKTEEERKNRIRQDEYLANTILEDGIEHFVNYWENIPLFKSQTQLPEQVQKSIRKQRLKNSPLGLANSLRGMGTGRQPSWWDHLQKCELPVLLLTGELDQKFCRIAKDMEADLPNCQHIIFPNVGHTIHLEEIDTFDQSVLLFLNK